MNKVKIFLVVALLLPFMFSVAQVPDRIKILIINSSEMSMQTIISGVVLDPAENECFPSPSWYVISVGARSNAYKIINNGANLCALEISTYINGDTCFIRVQDLPSRLGIVIPEELGPDICNRIIYRYRYD